MIDCEKIVEIKNFHSFGLYKSRLWVLRYGYNGMPCGYVLLTDAEREKYPNDNYYDEVDKDIEMYGGCTYIGNLMVDDYLFIGFDCCHYEDTVYPKTFGFAESECKSIIDQLIDLKGDK